MENKFCEAIGAKGMSKNMGDPRPIGIFDSGVGGLTVAREIHRLLPGESTIYVGDTARVPYGTKTPRQLLAYAHDIIHFLLSQNVKAVVIACGTSSANTYGQLQIDFPSLPLVDVITPGVDCCAHLVQENPGLRLGIIATAATIKSGLFSQLLAEKCPNTEVYAKACPLFASMVEAGLPASHPAVTFAVKTYLADLRGKIDALVLGCTHYPLLTNALAATLGDVNFINIGEATALATKAKLTQLGLLARSDAKPMHRYYITGPGDVFRTTGSVILGEACEPESCLSSRTTD
ncbi:MAG: glutamate racemase [Defluviitaleaceae bacterium]|nr:glutamate racemase [Defluviitaleaceae bacterium]